MALLKQITNEQTTSPSQHLREELTLSALSSTQHSFTSLENRKRRMQLERRKLARVLSNPRGNELANAASGSGSHGVGGNPKPPINFR